MNVFNSEKETIKKNKLVGTINNSYIEIYNLNMRGKDKEIKKNLIWKMIISPKIVIHNSDIKVLYDNSNQITYLRNRFQKELSPALVIRADSWTGLYEEYDLVSNIWPIIPDNFFRALHEEYKSDILIQHRVKNILETDNGIVGIAELDPILINPKLGILSRGIKHRTKKHYIGEFKNIESSYWLFELNNYGTLIKKQKKDFILFVFIAPRHLNSIEEIKLSNLYGDDDVYIKGVREGWSILFIGHTKKYIIMPGIVKKADIIKQIPNSILNNLDRIIYYNLDGTRV